MPIIFIIFVVVPVIEITILIKVGQAIGGWYTVGLVLLSAFIGVNMLRYQGVTTLLKARTRIESGEIPLSEMRDGILIAIGGALLVTPGFVTDVIGFSCLLPFTRGLFFNLFGQRISAAFTKGGGQTHFYSSSQHSQDPFSQNRSDIIDGDFVEVNDPSNNGHNNGDDKRLH